MYHISRHFLGSKATFSPRIPFSQNENEINMNPRVCASPNVDLCWKAISVCGDLNKSIRESDYTGVYYFVYKMDEKTFVKNENVMDFEKTQEYISHEPVNAELIDVFYVNSSNLKNGSFLQKIKEKATISESINAYFDYQKDLMISIEKSL
jgi:hypothetical protein